MSDPGNLTLGAIRVGAGEPCLIVCEVAQAHDGSLGAAHAYIDAVAGTGAGAVKFQTHIAAAESTPGEPWRVPFSPQDATRYDYWKRMEFTEIQWRELKRHAEERGLIFLSSPFSVEAADLLERIGVPAWKLASGEGTNLPLLRRLSRTGLPVLVSSGMSSFADLDRTVRIVREGGSRPAVLQCTSAYPCPPEKIGLELIEAFRRRYACPAGLSDHSGSIVPGLAAAALGCDILEVHVTFSRQSFGPDVPASLTISEAAQLVEGIRVIERMRAHPVDKDALAAEMRPMREIFGKRLVSRAPIPQGAVLAEEHLAFKKAAAGLGAERVDEVIGRRLRRALAADEPLCEEDILR